MENLKQSKSFWFSGGIFPAGVRSKSFKVPIGDWIQDVFHLPKLKFSKIPEVYADINVCPVKNGRKGRTMWCRLQITETSLRDTMTLYHFFLFWFWIC